MPAPGTGRGMASLTHSRHANPTIGPLTIAEFSKMGIEISPHSLCPAKSITSHKVPLNGNLVSLFHLSFPWQCSLLPGENKYFFLQKCKVILLMGMQVGAANMENRMEVPQKTKTGVAIWSSDLSPGHTTRQNHNSKRYMHSYVHSSTIHNSQDMLTTSMSTDRWTVKEDVEEVCVCVCVCVCAWVCV